MKQLFKIFFSVFFLTLVSVFSVRYFIIQKISQNQLGFEARNLIEDHFANTIVKIDGFEYEVGSDLILKFDELNIVDTISQQNFLSIQKLHMKIPLAALITNKGRVKTNIEKVDYSYRDKSHLLNRISDRREPKNTSFPPFMLKSRHDIRIESVKFNNYQLGRLSLKNIRPTKTTAFEIKKKITDEYFISGDLRVIGEISLQDLFSTGKINILSSFNFEDITLKNKPNLGNFTGKGNFETSGTLDQLRAKIRAESPGNFEFTSEARIDSKSIALQEIEGTLENSKIFPNFPESNISFTGETVFDMLKQTTFSKYSFKNLRTINYKALATDFNGTIENQVISIKIVSTGFEGEILSNYSSKFNLSHLASSLPIMENGEWGVLAKNLNFNLFKFGDFFNDKENFLNINYPDFKFKISFRDFLIREQLFKGELIGDLGNSLFEIKEFKLSDSKGELSGSYSAQQESGKWIGSAKLIDLEMDFLKAIMGNKDIHLTGQFSGSVVSLDLADENILKFDLRGKKGEITGLYEILQLQKIYEVAYGDQVDNYLNSKDFALFNDIKIQLSLSPSKLEIENFVFNNQAAMTDLSAKGSIMLTQGPSRIMGKTSKKDLSLEFLLEGNSVFFSPNISYTEREYKNKGDRK